MMNIAARLAMAGAVLSFPLAALAADPAPDIKGRWVGKTHSIVAGKSQHWPSSAGTFDKPALSEKDLVLEVRGQEGARFWGVSILSGGGEKTEEPFVGHLYGKDNKEVLIADTDGYIHGELSGDVLSFCYAQAGTKLDSSVVSCTEVKHAK
jgi:hypothetical protein